MVRPILSMYRQAFTGLPRPVWTLALVALVNRAGTMVLPFLSLYLTQRIGLGETETGWVLFAFGVGSIGGSWLGGWLSGRWGAIPVQALSLLGGGVGFLALSRLHTLAAFIVGVFLLSLVGDALRPASMAAMVDLAPVPVKTRSLALLRMAANLGMVIGPAVGGLLAGYNYLWLFVGDGLTCWLAAALLWWRLGGRKGVGMNVHTGPGLRTGDALRDRPFLGLLGIMFAMALVFFQILGTMPLYLREAYGCAEETIGLLFGLSAFLVVGVEMVLVRHLEHRNHLRLLGLGAFLLCGGFSLLPLGHTGAFAALTVVVWTCGEMLALPFANSLVASRAGTRGSGTYMGLYTATFALALMIAPLAGFWIYEHLGPRVLWHGIGGVGAVLWIGALLLAPRFRNRPAHSEATEG